MRLLGLLSFALLALWSVASPLREESSVSVEIAEDIVSDGSHFIVSVQRYHILMKRMRLICRTDDVKEDSGALIAEKVTNIVCCRSLGMR